MFEINFADALCNELEQERKIRFSMQQKLKGNYLSGSSITLMKILTRCEIIMLIMYR